MRTFLSDLLRLRSEDRIRGAVPLNPGQLDWHADLDPLGRAADDRARVPESFLFGKLHRGDGERARVIDPGCRWPLVETNEEQHPAAAAHLGG
jgi:hypothetical protein